MTTIQSKDSDLPELPITNLIGDVYAADQMRDYARKAIAAQTVDVVPVGEVIDFGCGIKALKPCGDLPEIGTKLYAAPPTQAIAKQPDDAILSLAPDMHLAITELLAWDKRRNFVLPYAIRDPLRKALGEMLLTQLTRESEGLGLYKNNEALPSDEK